MRAAASRRIDVVEGKDEMKKHLNATSDGRSQRKSPKPDLIETIDAPKSSTGESTSAYAIRMAGERRKQRQEKKNQELMSLSMYRGKADDHKENISSVDRFDGSDVEEQEQDDDDDDDDDMKQVNRKELKPETVRSGRRSSWKLIRVVWTMGAILVIVGAYFWAANVQFCDTDQEDPKFCNPCPEHGICLDGELARCRSPYILFHQECVESKELQHNAHLMFQEWQRLIESMAEQLFCRSTIPGWIREKDGAEAFKEGKLLSKTDFRSMVRQNSLWKNSDKNVFDATFGKALKLLQHSDKEFQVNGSIRLSQSRAPLWCQFSLWSYDYRQHIFTVICGFVGIWLAIRGCLNRAQQKALHHEILAHVHDGLMAQTKASKIELRGYPVDNLRDHIYDVLGMSATKRTSVTKLIWPKVVRSVAHDSRIRERNVLLHGRQTKYWEWIAPELPLSERQQRRQSKTPDTKKTLDFGTSLPIQGNSTLLY